MWVQLQSDWGSKEQNSILNEKLTKAETIVKNLEHTIKLETKDKKNVEDANDKITKENKSLKQEISELNKEIKAIKIDLKTAVKDRKDTSHNYEKKISELEMKNNNLIEFKTLKETTKRIG